MFKILSIKNYFWKIFRNPITQEDDHGFILTRSRYLTGLKCTRLLWSVYNDKKSVKYQPKNESNHKRQSIQNDSLTPIIHKLFPGGIQVEKLYSMKESSLFTNNALSEKRSLYGASFLEKGLFSRSDLLIPNNDGTWDLFFFKSALNIKKDYLEDIAFQCHVAELSGIKIKTSLIYLINQNYKFNGELIPEELLVQKDVTEKVQTLKSSVIQKIKEFLELIRKPELPPLDINRSCGSPKVCMLKNCWSISDDSDIFNLREGKDIPIKLYQSGINYLKDIPDEIELTFSQKIQIESLRSGNTHLNKEKLADFLSKIKYPVYYLDFETINPALPVYKNSSPFQHVPFLYSLHVIKTSESEPEHFSFIDDDSADPRQSILEQLSKLISLEGTIICYNDVFEKKCLKESADLFKEFQNWLKSIHGNFLDLSIPFKNFHYYNPLQKGSASLKSVLPALTGQNYSALEIHDGNSANLEFLRTKTQTMPIEEKLQIRKDLVEYCRMDTFAMHLVIEALKKILT